MTWQWVSFLNDGAVERKEKCQVIPGGNDCCGLSVCVFGMFGLEDKPSALVLRGRVLRRCPYGVLMNGLQPLLKGLK